MRKLILSTVIFILSVLLLGIAPGASAQAAKMLKYGDAVTGEISAAAPQVNYTFSGKKGDVVVIDIDQNIITDNKVDYSKLWAGVLATDSAGKKIIDSGTYGPQGAALLPADGDYNIVVTPRKGAQPDNSVGKFRLVLSRANLLKPGETIAQTLAFATPVYFLLPSNRPFALNFEQTSMDLNYVSMETVTIAQQSDYSTGAFLHEPTIPTRGMTAASMTFDKIAGDPVVLRLILSTSGKTTPIDFKLTLQSDTAQAAAATSVAVAVTPASANTLVAPPSAAANINLAGNYQISGANSDGSTYQGTLAVKQTGTVYLFSRQTSVAVEGIGIQQDNIVSVAYGSTSCGLAGYLVQPDGSLDGQWGVIGQQQIGKERFVRSSSFTRLEGSYNVTGTAMNGAAYAGTATIKKTDVTYQVNWTTGYPYVGLGILRGNVLGVGFGDKGCGIAVYQIQADGSLDGQWGLVGQQQAGTERAVKSK